MMKSLLTTPHCSLLLVLSVTLTFGELPVQADQPPNVVTEQPSEIIVPDGGRGNVTLDCQVTGQPAPDIMWYVDGLPIEPNPNRAVVLQNGTLSVSYEGTQELEVGEYFHCTARNSYGVAFGKRIFVASAGPNALPGRLREINFRPRESLKLSCLPPSLPRPNSEIYWKKRRQTGGQSTPVEMVETKMMDSDGNLYFTSVPSDEAGSIYICAVRGSASGPDVDGTPQQLIPIPSEEEEPSFVPPHTLLISDAQQIGLMGSDITLRCILGGYPTPVVSWTGPNGLTSSGMALTIIQLSASDVGVYRCLSGMMTHEFMVTVEAKPYWQTEPPSLLIASPGEDVVVECSAGGVPEVNTDWFFNGEALPSDSRISVDRGLGRLTIRNITETDARVIQCLARNRHGNVFANVGLMVRGAVPRVSDAVTTHNSTRVSDSCLTSGPMYSCLVLQRESSTGSELHLGKLLELKTTPTHKEPIRCRLSIQQHFLHS